jgi:hypothetical protein
VAQAAPAQLTDVRSRRGLGLLGSGPIHGLALTQGLDGIDTRGAARRNVAG